MRLPTLRSHSSSHATVPRGLPLALRLVLLVAASVVLEAADLGPFDASSDIGAPRRPGSASPGPRPGELTLSGGGANMWFTNDALHFVWKRLEAGQDITLAADVHFPGTGGNPHRKACLLIRQDLSPEAAYADAALHGDGLTSLQYRETRGGMTREIQANLQAPRRLRLEKRGRYVSMSVAPEGQPLRPSGGAFRLDLEGPVYVGLGVCAHDDAALETAVFSGIELAATPTAPASAATNLISTLETVVLASKDRRAVWWTPGRIEAPNWSPDGSHLVFNGQGRLHRIPATGGQPTPIDTGFAVRCNNDHGFSPDGSHLVISDQSQGDRRSRIYILPAAGGVPRQVTPLGPSYWHGWSPDGKTLAYCAERQGLYDIYTMPVEGGNETRLTSAPGLDDGPDYSPDGRFLYFNSDREGRMQIWRMKPDGSDQNPLVADEWNNWFPHPSPDGRWLVFLSYAGDVKGHPEDKDVTLRLMELKTGRIEVLAKLFGGQGTINVPSWSPDSRRLAFVSYQRVP